MPAVFLSHSSKDQITARKLAEQLKAAKISVWLDEWEILVGDSIVQKVQHGLEKTDFVAVLLTRDAILSGWVEKEWQSRIGDEATQRRVVILPLKFDDCVLPPLLKDKKYSDFQHDFDSGFADLLKAVRAHSLQRDSRDLNPVPSAPTNSIRSRLTSAIKRTRFVTWLTIFGAAASLLTFFLVYRSRPVDPVLQLDRYMHELASDPTLNDRIGNKTRSRSYEAIENLCKDTPDTDRVISALQNYVAPRNETTIRLTAVQILSDLSREQKLGNIKRPKGGFLSHMDLSNLTLDGQDFSDVDLVEAKFTGTSLIKCRFQSTDLQRAIFLRANLSQVFIYQAELGGANFRDTTLDGAILAQANLEASRFEHCSFDRATLFACNLSRSYVVQPSLREVKLLVSSLNSLEAVGGYAVSNGSKCAAGTGFDFRSAHLNWVPRGKASSRPSTVFFPSSNMFNFEFAPEEATDLSSANLKYADFTGQCIRNIKFVNAVIYGGKFDRATLDDVDFEGADLTCASFHNADLSHTRNLAKARSIRDADFTGAVAPLGLLKDLQTKGGATSVAQSTQGVVCVPMQPMVSSPLPPPGDADNYSFTLDLRQHSNAPKQPRQAIEYYSQVLRTAPDDQYALEQRARAYWRIQAYQDALNDYAQLSARNPLNASIPCDIGRIYIELDKMEKAKEYIERSVNLDPSNASCHAYLGIVLASQTHLQAAITEFDKAVSLDSSQDFFFFNRGLARSMTRDYESALADFGRAIELSPNDWRPYAGRATAHRALGHTHLADQDKRNAQRLQLR